uniref:Uncharacterized protein LOC101500403 n=1 Tax=Cicer arietinum TaxID=3827 RepID=A0A3Q7XX29_CICAR
SFSRFLSAALSGTTQTEEEVTLKLLVNKVTNKVIFAEAEKDFVDVLFSFLTFPLGTISRLLEKESSIGPLRFGSVNTLYHSVEDLDKGCFGKHVSKEMLLQTANSSQHYCRNVKLNIDDSEPTEYFVCSKFPSCDGDRLVISINKHNCCHCGSPMTRSVLLKHFNDGFVKDGATFIITDDLTVMPNSMDITNFGFLQNFGIKNATSVKEMTVSVTKEKYATVIAAAILDFELQLHWLHVLDLLKCSLFSKTALTHLFLREKQRFINWWRAYPCPVEDNSNSNIEITVKLVIRKSDGRLLYAQGGQDFAKMLLSFLTIPLGGIVPFLRGSSLGSINTLYKSVANLDEDEYFVSEEAKDRIVDPQLAGQYFDLSKDILSDQRGEIEGYYCYYQLRNYDTKGIGPNQVFLTDRLISNEKDWRYMYASSDVYNEVYVKGPRVYVATDDLVIAPLSPISLVSLINRFETPFEDLKEKVVTIGIKEYRCILEAALTTPTALTTGLTHLLYQ